MFSFGTPSSAPATGLSATGGFNFGANKPATPGFGLTASSQPSSGLFGNTSSISTPAFGSATTPAFGTPATPAFGAASTPAFGAASTPAFGAASTPAFGAASTPAFGAASTPAFGAASTPAFGAASTPAFGAASTPAFGASSTPAFGATTPAFGATSAPAFGATTAPAFGTSAPTFGATTTTAFGTTPAPAFGAGGLNFGIGNTSTSTGIPFGTSATTANTSGLGGLGGFGFNTTPASTTPGFGLLGSTATTSATPGLFTPSTKMLPLPTHPNVPDYILSPSVNQPNSIIPVTQTFQMLPTIATTSCYNTPYNLAGLNTSLKRDGFCGESTNSSKCNYVSMKSPRYTSYPTMTCGTSLGGTTNTISTQLLPAAAPSLGLGGVAPSTSGIGTSTTNSTDAKDQQPKQSKLPNELSTSVDSFKEFVKKQKSLSSDVMRVSIKPLHKVGRTADELVRAVAALSGEVGRARAHSRRLRAAAAGALAAAERAARDLPGSNFEGSAPPVYVKELISELEQQLITFRRQMDVADKQMQASPRLLSEQELTLGIRRMHESLVALAARLQAAHAQVDAQKAQYLNLRKYVLKDPTDVFRDQTGSTSLEQILCDAEGHRKKTKMSVGSGNVTSAVIADPIAALGSMQQLAGPTPFTYFGSTVPPYHSTDTTSPWQSLGSGSMMAPTNYSASAFQLQKPLTERLCFC